MTSKLFTDVVDFSRGTGATRINAAGLIVGIDFSLSSVVFGSGSKTFTLAAPANVNRDWPVGHLVRAFSQAAPLGEMVGTVVSYNPATQQLTINVTSSTGSGTGTNWRIGSLEKRQDTNGILSEPGSTNLLLNSDVLSTQTITLIPNTIYTLSFWGTGSIGLTGAATGTFVGNGVFPATRQQTTFFVTTASLTLTVSGTVQMGQVEPNPFATSYIPTTTAQATRNGDSFPLKAASIAAIRQGEASIVIECNTTDIGVAQKRLARLIGALGEIRVAKRGVGTQGSIVRLTEGDGKLIMPVVSGGNTVSNNGLESLPITATVNERTGLPDTVLTSSAWAFNGTNQFGYVGGTTEERFLSSDFSLWSGKGLGATTMTALKWIGTRFLIPSSTAGLLALSGGDSYRRVNTPVITGITNNSATGNISGGIVRTVLVGNTGQIYTSDNQGETWTARTSGTTGNLQGAAWAPVGGANGTFVAISSNVNGSRYSTDGGITWLAITGVGANGFNDIKFANGLFVAVGLAGVVYTSTDGIAYTAATNTNTVTNLNGVDYDTATLTWTACGVNGTIIVTTTPTGTWTRYDNTTTPSTGTTNTLGEVRSFLGNFYAVGVGGTIVEYPPSALTFTSRTSGTNQTLNGLDVDGTGTTLLICGSTGPLFSTTNGTTYTPRSSYGQAVGGIAYGNGTCISGGNTAGGSGYLATIGADGTLTRRAIGLTTNNFVNVRFINGFFYALETGNAVARTADGVTVTRHTWAGTQRTTNAITTDGASIIAFQNNNSYSISTDNGVTFGAQIVATLVGNITSAFFANGLWVVATQAGTTEGRIYTTATPSNGASWVQRFSGTSPLRSVIFSTRDQLWYASGDNGTLLYATDPMGAWLPVQNASLGAIQNTTLQASLFDGQFVSGRNKIGLSYKSNQVILSLNGVSVTDPSATIPNITSGFLAENLNGYLKTLKVPTRALSSSELNAMTAL